VKSDDDAGKGISDKQSPAEAMKRESQNLFQQIQSMTVAEKIQFALHAGKDARSILIRDSNKQVAMAVLHSPKITEDEILLIAQSRNVSDDILRLIAKNKDWAQKYSICLALVNNPKTPLSTALSFLSMIKRKDMVFLAKNRNIGEALRSSAIRLLQTRFRDS